MRRSLVLVVAIFLAGIVVAQVPVALNVNVVRQPVWGPTGYDYVEYYYLPDIDTYYSVPQGRFYYYEGGQWVGRTSLPVRYRTYDFYNSYKVVVNEPAPYKNDKVYKEKYFSYRGRHDQILIRDSRDAKYFAIKNHPEHNNWVKQQKHDNRANKPGRK